MVSFVIEILHFESLNMKEKQIRENEIKYLEDFTKETSENPMLQNNALNTLFDEYDKYKIDTREGKHGKTPQYFMMYVHFVHYYLM